MANTGALGSPDQRAYQNSLSPVSSTTAGLLANPSWQSQISGYLSGQAAPSLAQGGLASALGSAQLGMVGPQLGVSQAELASNQGYSLANALLGYEGIGLQSQGLASQASTAAAQQGVEQAEYGVQSGQYPEQMQEAALANANAVKNMQDQGAIGGTLGTQGYARQQATQAAQYGWQQADIYRAQQLAALGQQSEQLGYQGQQNQFGNQQAQLALAAQGEGLSAQQAQTQFGFGLQQLGIQASPEQYLSAIANAQGGAAQSLAALGSQASLIGGLGPNFLGNIGG